MCRKNLACGMSEKHQAHLGLLVHGMLYTSPLWMAAQQTQPWGPGSGCLCRHWRQRRRLAPKPRPCCSDTLTVSTGMIYWWAVPLGPGPRR